MTRVNGGRGKANQPKPSPEKKPNDAPTRAKGASYVFTCGHRERFHNIPDQFPDSFMKKLAAVSLCHECQIRDVALNNSGKEP